MDNATLIDHVIKKDIEYPSASRRDLPASFAIRPQYTGRQGDTHPYCLKLVLVDRQVCMHLVLFIDVSTPELSNSTHLAPSDEVDPRLLRIVFLL